MYIEDTPECFAAHMGEWAIDPTYLAQALAAIKAGTAPMIDPKAVVRDDVGYKTISNGVAAINIHGPLMKGVSKFGGTSTVLTRKAIRQATQDDDIDTIVLHVDSPGGRVAGTMELAAEVRRAAAVKTVHAHIDDLGASAAYWSISGATTITANQMAQVGSIGTIAVLYDSSERMEKEGIKVHVISTGAFKGSGTPGTEITKADIAEFQKKVDEYNEFFLKGVSDGRKIPIEQVEQVADGRVYIASEARSLGLIDEIMSYEDAVNRYRTQDRGTMRSSRVARAQLDLLR